ncbi:MAG: hypothetical protein OH318_01995 [Candidatus Parvarchaeota archaeon]|nr:hypothetical protein [Candidatus Rehaiarchaeum fermentans]
MIDLPVKYKEYAKSKGIDENKILNKYENSLIDPYLPIGIIAAQSITEASSQATLKTKHVVGIQEEVKTSATLPRLMEIFDARERPESPSMTIYLNKEKIKDLKDVEQFIYTKLVEIKIKDILLDYEVDLVNQSIKLIFDKNSISENMIDFNKVKNLLKPFNIEKYAEYSIVIKPNYKEFHKEALKIINKIKNITISGIKGIERAVTKIENGEFVIKTEGSNLKDVLELEEVDPSRVFTNDIIETYQVLGIEAARNLIVKEALKTLASSGLKVDIRHLYLVADLMCWEGNVVGVTRYGIVSRSPSVLTRMAFEMPVKNLVDASVFHEKEEFKYLFNNIITNQVIPVGTGKVKVVVKEDGNNGGNKEGS